jgi:hypothetical protein
MYSLHPIIQDVIITSIVLYGTEGVLKSQKLILFIFNSRKVPKRGLETNSG